MRYTQKHPQHTHTKRDIYYFSSVIPSDLQHHYIKSRIIQSLKTKSEHKATTASKMLSEKLGDYWLGLRLKQIQEAKNPRLTGIFIPQHLMTHTLLR
jgi:hypothetical protein